MLTPFIKLGVKIMQSSTKRSSVHNATLHKGAFLFISNSRLHTVVMGDWLSNTGLEIFLLKKEKK